MIAAVRRHCEAKGYREGEGVNDFVPHDPVAAFAAARRLVGSGSFDRYLAVAPEGHVHGWFFERLGARVLSIHVGYPPVGCAEEDDLSVIRGERVLVIEDDVIGGGTLRLVAEHLRAYAPRSLALFLGHIRGVQHLENVPPDFEAVWLADGADERDEDDFAALA